MCDDAAAERTPVGSSGRLGSAEVVGQLGPLAQAAPVFGQGLKVLVEVELAGRPFPMFGNRFSPPHPLSTLLGRQVGFCGPAAAQLDTGAPSVVLGGFSPGRRAHADVVEEDHR